MYLYSTSRNFPYYYYKLTYKIPDGNIIDIIMLDTVLLCGNTLSDFVHDQPKGPADFMVAQDQWAWLEQQLASSKYVYIFIDLLCKGSRLSRPYQLCEYASSQFKSKSSLPLKRYGKKTKHFIIF